MRRRFQEGGLNDMGDEAGLLGDDGGSGDAGGALGGLGVLLSSITQNMTTTPEARKYATDILTQIMDQTKTGVGDEPVLGKMKAQAEEVRKALQAARARLLAQNYNPGDALLAASQALGAPTKTGSIGETMSNVFGAVREPLAKRGEFNRQRDTALSQLDLAEAQLSGPELEAELQLQKIRETLQSRMGAEALRTLGKPLAGAGNQKYTNIVPPSAQALDRSYVKDYNEFISGGSAKAAQGLEQLGSAIKDLRRKGNDTISGPVIGSIASIPYVGRAAQDILTPGGSDVRANIENTVQNTLRPILGAQFTRQEGEALLARVFNPRLEEWRNARRLQYLLTQLQRAYANKVALANYYQKNHTIYGFQGKTDYTIDDFEVPDSVGRGPIRKDENPEDFELSGAAKASLGDKQILFTDEAEREAYRKAEREARPKRARGGMVRFDEGGPVMDLGDDNEEPPSESKLHELSRLIEMSPGTIPIDMGIGALGGLGAESALTALTRQLELPGYKGRTKNAERLIFNAITRGAKNPVREAKDVADEIKRSNRMGVPEQLLDVDTPGIQGMTENALTFGGRDADEALDALRNKVEGSRGRVNAQVNKGLKPYSYFDHANTLASKLETQAKPIFQAAYAKAPGLPADPVLDEIIQTPEGQRALQWAMRFYTNVPGRQIGKVNPVTQLVQKPSLEFYDYIRKGFDQIIGREEKGGDPTEFSREVLRPLRKMFTDRLDQIGPPEYAQARQQYAGDLEVRDALKAGTGFDKMNTDQLADMAGKMSFHEKNAFRTGMAQRLYDMLDKSSSDNFNAAQRISGSPDLMAKLKPFFDSDKEFEIFQTALEKEADMFRTGRALVDRGSGFRRTAEKERQGVVEGAVKHAAGFRYAVNPVGWALRIMRSRPRMGQAEASRVLDILQRGDPAEMDAFAKAAEKLGRSRVPRAAAAAAVGAGLKTLFGHDLPPESEVEEEEPADVQ